MKPIWMARTMILACMLSVGCETESQRLASMADRTVEMQSEQNSIIAKTTSGMVELNREIQNQRKELTEGHKQLENDRRQLHLLRRSELAWAESLQFLAIIVAASMPLFLCAYLVWATTRSAKDAELVNEVLLEELVTKQPRLIAGPNLPAIEDHSAIDTQQRLEANQNSTTNQERNH